MIKAGKRGGVQMSLTCTTLQQTERDAASRKLELNGYLTKPTTRLGRYTLLLDKIHSRTSPNHPDKESIPFIIDAIKHLLQRVNNAAGAAKNRFDLEQIHRHLTFKNKKDIMDLHLLDQGRSIIKQGTLRKTASMDSTEYQVILLDHYLVTAKVKVLNAVEHYCVQKRVSCLFKWQVVVYLVLTGSEKADSY